MIQCACISDFLILEKSLMTFDSDWPFGHQHYILVWLFGYLADINVYTGWLSSRLMSQLLLRAHTHTPFQLLLAHYVCKHVFFPPYRHMFYHPEITCLWTVPVYAHVRMVGNSWLTNYYIYWCTILVELSVLWRIPSLADFPRPN